MAAPFDPAARGMFATAPTGAPLQAPNPRANMPTMPTNMPSQVLASQGLPFRDMNHIMGQPDSMTLPVQASPIAQEKAFGQYAQQGIPQPIPQVAPQAAPQIAPQSMPLTPMPRTLPSQASSMAQQRAFGMGRSLPSQAAPMAQQRAFGQYRPEQMANALRRP